MLQLLCLGISDWQAFPGRSCRQPVFMRCANSSEPYKVLSLKVDTFVDMDRCTPIWKERMCSMFPADLCAKLVHKFDRGSPSCKRAWSGVLHLRKSQSKRDLALKSGVGKLKRSACSRSP